MHPLLLTPVSSLSPALASTLIASIWQGALLTSVVALSLRLLPGLSAAAKSAIWTAVLVLIVALPTIPLTFAHARAPGKGLFHLEDTISFAIIALWAAASAFRLVQLAMSALRLRSILQRARHVTPSDAVSAILQGNPRRVTLCTSNDIDRPSVAGFLRPRILFPPELLAELSEAELTQIVLHEAEHLRRYDDWINLLQQISLVLFPLNPALLWLNRRLSLERELACDDSVLQATRARKAYAACLAHVAENSLARRSAALVLGVLGTWTRKPELASRVERILRSPGRAMTRPQMRFATATLLAGMISMTGAIAHSPQLVSFTPPLPAFAQTAPDSVLNPPSPHFGLPRPTLVKAVMPAPSASTRPAVAITPHRQIRLTTRTHPAAKSAPWVVLTAWQQPSPEAQQISVPVVHLTTVVIQDSQTWYTAVAVRDGWIVVQL